VGAVRCISLAPCHVASASRIPHGDRGKTQSMFLGYWARDRAQLSYEPLFIFAEDVVAPKRALPVISFMEKEHDPNIESNIESNIEQTNEE